MPILSGSITPRGAVIDVLVGVSDPRRQILVKHGFPVPAPLHVRALIDTGADVSGFAPRLFTALGLTPVDQIALYTPSTPPNCPHMADVFDVSLSVVAGGSPCVMPISSVFAADGWLPEEGIEALIGRDILDSCFFQYMGPDRTFTLAF